MNIGKSITNITSRLGLICSKKAAIRLATETGQAMVDKSVKLGRDLTISEINSVFQQTLPKRVRPKIITSMEEGAKEVTSRTKMSIDESLKLLDGVGGTVFSVGTKKSPLMVIEEQFIGMKLSKAARYALYAHELEHALEFNNRPINILKRKIIEPLILLGKDKAKYHRELNEFNLKFQRALWKNKFHDYQNLVNIYTKGDKSKIKILKEIMDSEIPAYTTGNNIEKYFNSLEITEGSIINEQQGHLASIYRRISDVLKAM